MHMDTASYIGVGTMTIGIARNQAGFEIIFGCLITG